jgi:hypothetical protein
MKKTWIALMVMFLVAGLNAGAMGGMVGVSIDGQWYDFQTTPTSVGFDIPDQTVGHTGAGTVRIVGTVDADPEIAYGIAVLDFGAPSIFSFTFSTTIVPLPAGPTAVRTSIVGGLTDFTGDGVAITATAAANPLQGGISYVQNTDVSGNPLIWSAGLSNSFGAGQAGSYYSYGAYAYGPVPGPAGPQAGPLTVNVSFSLTGGGDIAALTGYSEIVPAPVPASLVLLGSGLLGLAGWRRRLG